jgi:hypothetical protein
MSHTTPTATPTGDLSSVTMTALSDTQVLVSPGTFAVGDPCYVIPSGQDWADLLGSCGFFNADPSLPNSGPVGVLHGVPVLAFGTAFGDGCYRGNDGRDYPVDAGLIGLVPVEVADLNATSGHNVITFTEPTMCTRTEDGTISFGSLTIPTGDQDEDEDWCSTCGVAPATNYGECENCVETDEDED